MKTKMIVKFKRMVSNQDYKRIMGHLQEDWNKRGMLVSNPNIEVQAVILENEKGEITVINLTDKKVKTIKNMLEKIKKLFKRKNKVQSIDT